MTLFRIIAVVILGMVLVNCGGSGTSPGTTPSTDTVTSTPSVPTETIPAYAILTDTSVVGPRTIAGTSIVTNKTTGDQTTSMEAGSLDPQTATLTVTNSQYSFASGANGFSTSGVMIDGTGATIQPIPGLADGYSYLFVYNGTYSTPAGTFDTLGVAGIATAAADVPSAGTAQYRGTANLTVNTQNALTQIYTNGTAVLDADFGTNSADLTLDSFIIKDPTGVVDIGPFDTVNVSQITIAGAAMTGGAFSFQKNGTTVDVPGSNASSNVKASFLGHTGTRPAEAGGVILATGDTGEVSGLFIAK